MTLVLLLCLCKSFQRTLSFAFILAPCGVFRKSECKGIDFINTNQIILKENFKKVSFTLNY